MAKQKKAIEAPVTETLTNNTEEIKSDAPEASLISILLSINDKLDKLVLSSNKTKLSEMSITDLNFLKEMLTNNVTMNNYPGGDIDLKVKSNDLIIKISNELNNRINIYQ